MNDQKEFQKKMIRYQILDSRIKALAERRDLLLAKMLEIENTLNSISEIKKTKGKEIFLPLGANVHVPGTIKKTKKMIVELGANVAVERNVKETKEILRKRKGILEGGLWSIEKEMVDLSGELSRLEPEISALLEKVRATSGMKAGYYV